MPRKWGAPHIDFTDSYVLPRTIRMPECSFLETLNARRTAVGGPLDLDDLSSLLWHSMLLRERKYDGRFGIPWESRSAPSGGGLHPIEVLCLSLGERERDGLYRGKDHALLKMHGGQRARALNTASVAELTGATAGTTLQFVADWSKLTACYENAESLLWRDSGALTACICLVAASLKLTAAPLGRIGTDILRAAGIREPFVGAGAVHVGKLNACIGSSC
ncbi:MAG: hypothetical protein F4182_02870 [Gammaproteobacteria bacterium]|nr:hypothetical protein [Gammaproteobacteria bacterium]